MMIYVFDRTEDIVGKGENADNLLFANAFNLEQSKILLFGKGLK